MGGDEGTSGMSVAGFREPSTRVNQVANMVVDAAVEVHRVLGPGYLESVYEKALVIELGLRGLWCDRQPVVQVGYKGHEVGEGRLDLLVERCVVVEIKVVDRLCEVHVAQALSYLKATGLQLALLLNFNVPVLLRGVKRVVRNPRGPVGDRRPGPSAPRQANS